MNARRSAAMVMVLWGLVAMEPTTSAAGKTRESREGMTLTVEITGFRNERGHARVALWHSREGFPKDASKAARRYKVPIVAGCAVVKVADLEPGPWAIAAFHDENDTGKIELGFLGIPKEGLGVSRNAKGSFGPPSFESAELLLEAGERWVSFKMVYY